MTAVWTTRSAELVGIGDTVALSLLTHPDAVGRIVAKTVDDHIQCLLVCHSGEPGGFVTVVEDQLLLRLPEGGEIAMRRRDYLAPALSATSLGQPEPRDDEQAADEGGGKSAA